MRSALRDKKQKENSEATQQSLLDVCFGVLWFLQPQHWVTKSRGRSQTHSGTVLSSKPLKVCRKAGKTLLFSSVFAADITAESLFSLTLSQWAACLTGLTPRGKDFNSCREFSPEIHYKTEALIMLSCDLVELKPGRTCWCWCWHVLKSLLWHESHLIRIQSRTLSDTNNNKTVRFFFISISLLFFCFFCVYYIQKVIQTHSTITKTELKYY